MNQNEDFAASEAEEVRSLNVDNPHSLSYSQSSSIIVEKSPRKRRVTTNPSGTSGLAVSKQTQSLTIDDADGEVTLGTFVTVEVCVCAELPSLPHA